MSRKSRTPAEPLIISQRALFVVLGTMMAIPAGLLLKLGLDALMTPDHELMPIDYFLLTIGGVFSASSLVLIGLRSRAKITPDRVLSQTYSTFFIPVRSRKYQLEPGSIYTEYASARSNAGHTMSLTKVMTHVSAQNKRVLLARFLDQADAEACQNDIETYLTNAKQR